MISCEDIEVTIRVMATGKVYQKTINDADTVVKLKQSIAADLKFPPHNIQLVAFGMLLNDDLKMIRNYYIKDGSFIYVLINTDNGVLPVKEYIFQSQPLPQFRPLSQFQLPPPFNYPPFNIPIPSSIPPNFHPRSPSPLPPESMLVFVKMLNGKTKEYRVEPTDTIFSLKSKIRDDHGIPECHQRLINNGHNLIDEKTMKEYNIAPETTFYLAASLR
jgi:hypothetical protein